MVYSTIPIIDASGRTASVVPIHPVYSVEIHPAESLDIQSQLLVLPRTLFIHTTALDYTISTFQLVACDITLQNATIDLDAQTGKPLSIPPSKGPSFWKEWTGPRVILDPLLQTVVCGVDNIPCQYQF